MAHYVLENAGVYLAANDLSGDLNQASLTYEAEIQDKTNFRSSGTREKIAGLRNVALAVQGLYEASSSGTDKTITALIGSSERVATVATTGRSAGARAFSFRAIAASYQPWGAVGEVAPFSLNAEGHGVLAKGAILQTGVITATTGAGNTTADSTPQNLGAATTGQTIYVAMHVLSLTAGKTLQALIQSDSASSFASPVTRVTMTNSTARLAQWKSSGGAVTDTWWRVKRIIGNSAAGTANTVINLAIQ